MHLQVANVMRDVLPAKSQRFPPRLPLMPLTDVGSSYQPVTCQLRLATAASLLFFVFSSYNHGLPDVLCLSTPQGDAGSHAAG